MNYVRILTYKRSFIGFHTLAACGHDVYDLAVLWMAGWALVTI
jgi:hypothetical protein